MKNVVRNTLRGKIWITEVWIIARSAKSSTVKLRKTTFHLPHSPPVVKPAGHHVGVSYYSELSHRKGQDLSLNNTFKVGENMWLSVKSRHTGRYKSWRSLSSRLPLNCQCPLIIILIIWEDYYSAFAVIRSLDQSCVCNIKLMSVPLTLGHWAFFRHPLSSCSTNQTQSTSNPQWRIKYANNQIFFKPPDLHKSVLNTPRSLDCPSVY